MTLTKGAVAMRAARMSRGLKQPPAARAAGVDQVQWSKWERGRGKPNVTNALKIQAAFPEVAIELWTQPSDELPPVTARDTLVEPVGVLHDEGEAPPPVTAEELAGGDEAA